MSPRWSSLFLVLCCSLSALAVPARPGWLAGLAEGLAEDREFRFHLVGDEFANWAESEDGYTLLQDRTGAWRYAEAAADGSLRPGAQAYRPGAAGPLAARGLRPDPQWLRQNVGARRQQRDGARLELQERVEGQWRLLLLLIRYPDQAPQVEAQNFDSMMNQSGWHGTGSFNDFYTSLSFDRFSTQSDVLGWYTAQHPHDYYGYNQGWSQSQELVREAVLAADAEVDYSQYDNNGDGMVDALLVVHTGQGAEEGNQSNIWSHRWAMWGQELELDGVTISDYTMQPELQDQGQSAIGVYVHEFGHALGLPDLYDTDYSSSGVGNWCVMSGGSWGGGGSGGNAHTPASFSAYCRQALGWATVTTVEGELLDHPLPALHLSDELVRLELPEHPGQYFLAENRRLVAWDQHQAGEGLYVWHVDENMGGNSDEDHYLVDLEQADGQRDLNHNLGVDAGDLFPGATNNRHFDAFSSPASQPYGGTESPVIITEIGAPADSMSVSFFQIFNHQDLLCTALQVVEDTDQDGVAEAGEDVAVRLTLLNRGAAVDSLWLELSAPDPGIEALESGLPHGPVATGEVFLSDLFHLRLDAELATGRRELVLDSRDSAGWLQSSRMELQVGRGDLLLMLDGAEPELATWYENALLSSGRAVERRRFVEGGPPQDLAFYPCVFWVTAEAPAPLDGADVQALRDYVEQGGHLLLSGQHLLDGLDEDGRAFIGADPGIAWGSMPRVLGLSSGGLLADDEALLLVGANGAWNQQLPTTSLSPRSGSVLAGRWSSSQNGALLRRTAGAGRLLVAGFSLEAAHGASNLLSLEQFLGRALPWLDEGLETDVAPAPEPARRPQGLSLAAHPNPFNPQTRLDVELAHAETLTLRVWDLAGRQVLERPLGLRAAGRHEVTLDLSGRASGLYLAEVAGQSGSRACTRLLLLK